MGLIATLALAGMYGCEETDGPSPGDDPRGQDARRDAASDDDFEDEDFDDEDLDDDDFEDEGASADAGARAADAGSLPAGDAGRGSAPAQTPKTAVPEALVGTWTDGAFDFVLWENYRERYWAGRNASPSREAMVFRADGTAKFYRYEAAFNVYEELIDCEGTVAFGSDGTFTFYPVQGRKRFYDTHTSSRNVDRPLTAEELTSPKLAGKRAYAAVPGASTPTLRITVPSSAPYNWYKSE